MKYLSVRNLAVMLAKDFNLPPKILNLRLWGMSWKRRNDWDQEVRHSGWEFLESTQELGRNSIIVGYYRHLKPGGAVLDIGCGQGVVQKALFPYGYRRYLGIDQSDEAIGRARPRMSHTTSFVVADATSFLTDDEFDVVILNECLYYFDHPDAVVQKYSKLLASDGIIIVSMHASRNTLCIWHMISDLVEVIDETVVYHESETSWIVRVLKPRNRPALSPAAVSHAETVRHQAAP